MQKEHIQLVKYLSNMLFMLLFKVGMRRFELPTSSTPCWRDTGLRYIPNFTSILIIFDSLALELFYHTLARLNLNY